MEDDQDHDELPPTSTKRRKLVFAEKDVPEDEGAPAGAPNGHANGEEPVFTEESRRLPPPEPTPNEKLLDDEDDYGRNLNSWCHWREDNLRHEYLYHINYFIMPAPRCRYLILVDAFSIHHLIDIRIDDIKKEDEDYQNYFNF